MASDEPNWGDTWTVLREVIHDYAMYLELHESAVLWFIFRRTRLYRKEWEAIPISHFEYGIVSQKGEHVIGPLMISRAKLKESLRHLEGKGIIEVKRSKKNGGWLPSEYRIRMPDEIITSRVFSYMRVHQQADFDKMTWRFSQNRGNQAIDTQGGRIDFYPRVGSKTNLAGLVQNITKGRVKNEPRVGSEIVIRIDHTSKDQITKSAPKALPIRPLRKTVRQLNIAGKSKS